MRLVDRWSRRSWFSRMATLAGAAGLANLGRFEGSLAQVASPSEPPHPGLIVRNRHPIDLETPVSALDSWLTGNDDFFVRSHLGEPAVELSKPWPITIGGLADKPLPLILDDLKRFEQVTIPAVLQCAGNGRAYFQPTIPGLPWEKGAVGHAEWTGVRLRDVLEGAHTSAKAKHIHFLGADAPPSPKTPVYLRSLPIERALDPSTLLATSMNGVPLPIFHGGPLRLVVPGWTGNHWMKWVRSITLADAEANGFYSKTAYRMPKTPVAPDVTLKPDQLFPLTFMNVKSLITAPDPSKEQKAEPIEIRGVAWTGAGVVDLVEISTDLEPGWKAAKLIDPPREGSWRRWSFTIEPKQPGELVVRARATDSKGDVQPDATPWNKSGYLWNGIDSARLRIV